MEEEWPHAQNGCYSYIPICPWGAVKSHSPGDTHWFWRTSWRPEIIPGQRERWEWAGERGKRAFSSRDDSMRGRGEIKDGVVKASVHTEGSLRHNILTFAKENICLGWTVPSSLTFLIVQPPNNCKTTLNIYKDVKINHPSRNWTPNLVIAITRIQQTEPCQSLTSIPVHTFRICDSRPSNSFRSSVGPL